MKHQEAYFKGFKDYNIYYQSWLPEGNIKAVLLVAHGYFEHSGRYGNVVNHFIPKGYAVYALDHRGHGRSDGARAQVDRFTDYIEDLKTFFDIVHKEHPGKKIFLIGHSMGSAISLTYALQHQHELAGIITSGARVNPPPPPKVSNQPISTSFFSRDPAVILAHKNDPLVYHGPMPPNAPQTKMTDNMPEELPKIKIPALIMGGDGCDDGEQSQGVYELIGSEDKTIKRYKNALHEIFNEPEHPLVMADMEKWLESHL